MTDAVAVHLDRELAEKMRFGKLTLDDINTIDQALEEALSRKHSWEMLNGYCDNCGKAREEVDVDDELCSGGA